jgi:plastocyanin
MRAALAYGHWPPAVGSWTWGDVEDYQVELGDTIPPQIYNLTPAPESIIEEGRPQISASYRDPSGIDVRTVRIIFNGIDVTAAATVTEGRISYRPPRAIRNNTTHTVTVEVADKVGNLGSKTWSFRRGEPKLGWVEIEPKEKIVPKGTPITFTTRVYDDEGKIWKYGGLSYQWFIGDEKLIGETKDTLTHTFEEAGRYKVKVVVTYKDQEKTGKASVEVVAGIIELLSVDNTDPKNTTIRYKLHQDTEDVIIILPDKSLHRMGDQLAGVHTSPGFNVTTFLPGRHLIKASGTVQHITLEDTAAVHLTRRSEKTGRMGDHVFIMVPGIGWCRAFSTWQSVYYGEFKWELPFTSPKNFLIRLYDLKIDYGTLPMNKPFEYTIITINLRIPGVKVIDATHYDNIIKIRRKPRLVINYLGAINEVVELPLTVTFEKSGIYRSVIGDAPVLELDDVKIRLDP